MSFFVFTWITMAGAVFMLVALVYQQATKLRQLRQDLSGTRADLIRQLREAELFRMATEHASDGILVQNMDGTVVWPNPAYCRIMGLKREEILGRNPLEYALPDEERPDLRTIASFRYDPDDQAMAGLQLFRNKRPDGTLFWNQISVSFRTSATGRQHAIAVCRDVTTQIEHENKLRETRSQLEFAATHDALTGLSNRAELVRFCEAALRRAAQEGGLVGMLHLDLDKFKEINDTHGHSAGDRTLVHVANVVRSRVRDTDLAARVGGDEFVVVCPEMRDLASLRAIAEDILGVVPTPFDWEGRALSCNASIGAAVSAPDLLDPEDLMMKSDFALYEAKRKGRNSVAVYDGRLHAQQTWKAQRAADLTRTIEAGGLDHHFQPIVDHRTGRLIGVETLVRWPHPRNGPIPPGEFLPMAAELGLMAQVDLGSMRAALDLKQVFDGNPAYSDLRVGFNASEEMLVHPDFVSLLIRGVESRGIARADIVIEVLETTVLGAPGDGSRQAGLIGDLRAAGFQVLLDDFGVGYAGLAHLAGLEVSGVKIDKSLVRHVLADETSAKIVATIADLCNDLGLSVVAEGVEEEALANRLGEIGCDVLQGYWLARPMTSDRLFEWLADYCEESDAEAPRQTLRGMRRA